VFKAHRRHEQKLLIEEVGKRLRGLMPWINAKEV
jgi:ketol-acid reductoisomerase